MKVFFVCLEPYKYRILLKEVYNSLNAKIKEERLHR